MSASLLLAMLPYEGLLGSAMVPAHRSPALAASRAAVDMKVFDWKTRDTPAPELETITLGSLKPAPGSHQKAKRKGRGVSAGQGVTCGFGNRGQKARAGSGTRPGFEGGQTPLYRRLPKWVGKPMGPGHSKKVYGLVKVRHNAIHPGQFVAAICYLDGLGGVIRHTPGLCSSAHRSPAPPPAAVDAEQDAGGQHGRLRRADRAEGCHEEQVQAQEGRVVPRWPHGQGAHRAGAPPPLSCPLRSSRRHSPMRPLLARPRVAPSEVLKRLCFPSPQAHAFTDSAKAAIEEQGGKCVVISPTTNLAEGEEKPAAAAA